MATFPRLPQLDLTKLDLTKLDLTKLDLTKLDLPGLDARTRDQVVGVLRDAAYVVIGAGVLGVQQLQVRRREITAVVERRIAALELDRVQLQNVSAQLDSLVAQLEGRIGSIDARLDDIEQRVDTRVDAAVEALESRLPEQAGAVVAQANELAKAARKQVRGLLRSAA
jgi:uncharacterized sporulation protein YeaH/YhbH (DUF444 family)